ncbi:MAG: hypothetical protein Kow0092_36020 [Deferrisomatales bacterium]
MDIQHRPGIAELRVRLHRHEGRTVVHVTHDFDLPAALSGRLLLPPRGAPLALGTPWEVLRPERIREAFSVAVRVEPDPATGRPRVLPVLPVGRAVPEASR